MKLIISDNAPKAIGPYSHAVQNNDLLFISGQLPLCPKTMEIVSTDVAKQTTKCIENGKTILEDIGGSLDDVIKTTIFLSNMDDFKVVNQIYADFFNGHAPARSCVQVAKLPLNALVEIEFIAAVTTHSTGNE